MATPANLTITVEQDGTFSVKSDSANVVVAPAGSKTPFDIAVHNKDGGFNGSIVYTISNDNWGFSDPEDKMPFELKRGSASKDIADIETVGKPVNGLYKSICLKDSNKTKGSFIFNLNLVCQQKVGDQTFQTPITVDPGGTNDGEGDGS